MPLRLRATLVAVTLSAGPGVALAAERPALTAIESPGAVRVDGVLDEPAWGTAGVASEFRLIAPREGEAPSESTLVRVLRDGDRVVFGIWCGASRRPHASLAARDQCTDGDHVALHLDTNGDGQRAYIFGVNPWGVQVDGILTLEPDFKWDGVWDASAHRGEREWTAEISVPFRILRIGANGRPWRMWVRRELRAWNEVASWPLYKVGEPGPIMLQAGDLDGLSGVRGGRELTVEPYAFGALLGDRARLAAGGTSAWDEERSREIGVDVQAALSPSLVANATWNPDFSQIEADALQIDVNRRFPLIYPEKRPFFLEGADHFVTLMDLVQTRRMADPRWGAKLTGRAGAWNTGALFVRDGGGASLLGSGYSPSRDDRLTRPGWYALARAQLPFGRGSNFGTLAGAHAQEAEVVPATTRELATSNVFGGLDAHVRLSANWSSEAQLVASTARLDSAGAGAAVESFGDWMGVWRLFYRDKARELHLGARHVGERFRDELGYQDFAGVTYRRIGGGWDLFPRTGPLLRVAPILDALVVHHHTGRLELGEYHADMDFELRRSAFVNAGYLHVDEHWRGRTYAQDRARAYAEWTAWRPLALELDASAGDAVVYGDTDAGSSLGWSEEVSLEATARPDPRVTAATNLVRYRLATARGGAEILDLWLVGVKATAQFTRRLSARLYPQYDSDHRHLALNALLGYVVQPGTVLFAGVNSGWDPDLAGGRRVATSRQFFAKASWRFAR
jgi:hypothetical protein